jgi:hypothetical protein
MTAARLSSEEMPIAHRRGLSLAEAATYCGISVDLFRRECGVVPIRIGHRVLYLRDRLDAWLDSKAVDGKPTRAPEWTPAKVSEAFNAAFAPKHRKTKAR